MAEMNWKPIEEFDKKDDGKQFLFWSKSYYDLGRYSGYHFYRDDDMGIYKIYPTHFCEFKPPTE